MRMKKALRLGREQSLKRAIFISATLHGLFFILFSIATVKEFYPQPKYLEVSLASPSEIKYVQTPAFPFQRASFQSNGQLPANFFYRVRRASIEVTLTRPQEKAEGGELFSLLPELSNLASAPIYPRGERVDSRSVWRILWFASPENQFWRERIALVKEVKLRIHLGPDGWISWIDWPHPQGTPWLDRLIKEAVEKWQLDSLSQDD